jgi:hypothetical protein
MSAAVVADESVVAVALVAAALAITGCPAAAAAAAGSTGGCFLLQALVFLGLHSLAGLRAATTTSSIVESHLEESPVLPAVEDSIQKAEGVEQ